MWWLLPLLLTPCLAIHTQEPSPPMMSSRSTPEERWLDVKLNQFMADNEETFPMRYYYNKLAGNDENIVIFVGGEWEISPGWASAGLAYDIAANSEASLFYTEHRYYGLTRPTGDTSSSELRYLTVDQALADLVQFITYVKSEDFESGQYRNAKVTLVGCSYAGSMVSWMSLAYPHLVDAALSDSGPLQAQENFPEYLDHLTTAIRSKGGADCVSSIQTGIERVQAILDQPTGAVQITEMFKTCSTIAASNQLDVATFFWSGIIERIAGVVQSAGPGDIEDMCETLTDTAVADPARRLANFVNTQPLYPPTHPSCLETRYTEMVAIARNTSYDAPLTSLRLWTYQTCVEYGWYQTTGSNQPFGNTVPLEFFHQMCKDFFSSSFNETLLRAGISRTNHFFGGFHLPDMVVSAQGQYDPWSPMGPSEKHAGPRSPVYVLPGASHCRAIRPLSESETEDIRKIKMEIMNDINFFLFGVRLSDATRAVSSMALLLALVATAIL